MPDRKSIETYRRACNARTPEEHALVDRLSDLHGRLTGLDSFFLPPARILPPESGVVRRAGKARHTSRATKQG